MLPTDRPVAAASSGRGFSSPSLRDDDDEAAPARDDAVLRELARALRAEGAPDALVASGDAPGEARVAFTGLRRRLGLHQQALTRTLRRLERARLVTRGAEGYALTPEGRALVGPASARPPGPLLPVMQALAPPHVQAGDVADHLARRWFRGLRWHGRVDARDGVVLSWLTVAGARLVRVRYARGVLTLEVEVARGEHLAALPEAEPLLKALAELYGREDAAA